ncbi:glycoside hydrolase family 125 protein [Zopfia rhizophila CBS 207.26]|uniref:Glycoside hydrolase family 125 protein n=1 Tax=Zopfia rhizophila CBS 207.26 TaxID=1314779 RepID=A0A6A6DEB4_9PEZI|nr:glycoside hydrolase family 125 protein [Zopfia rhizophila CBS 207.26]
MKSGTAPLVGKVIDNMNVQMVDKDLARIFENVFPNTLDTTVRWHVDGTDKKKRNTLRSQSLLAQQRRAASRWRGSFCPIFESNDLIPDHITVWHHAQHEEILLNEAVEISVEGESLPANKHPPNILFSLSSSSRSERQTIYNHIPLTVIGCVP